MLTGIKWGMRCDTHSCDITFTLHIRLCTSSFASIKSEDTFIVQPRDCMCPHVDILRNSCTWPTVQLYMAKLHVVSAAGRCCQHTWPTVRWSHHRRWPAVVHSHVTHCRQLLTTKLHGASSRHMAKLCMAGSYTWPAVVCGLVTYGQWFCSAYINTALQQQGLAARGPLRGVFEGTG